MLEGQVNNLKNSPFCGSDDIRVEIQETGKFIMSHKARAICFNCNANTEWIHGGDAKWVETHARDAWNKRKKSLPSHPDASINDWVGALLRQVREEQAGTVLIPYTHLEVSPPMLEYINSFFSALGTTASLREIATEWGNLTLCSDPKLAFDEFVLGRKRRFRIKLGGE